MIITTNDYPPYTSTLEEGNQIVTDIVKSAFKSQGIPLEVWIIPWSRGERMLLNGAVFGSIPYFKTDERQQEFIFSDPIIYSKNRFFFHKQKIPNQKDLNTLEDFKGNVMGAVRGYWYVPDFEKYGLDITYVNSDRAGLKMLLIKRIDYIIVDEIVGHYIVSQEAPNKLHSIGILDKAESVAAFHLMISKQYPNSKQLTVQFNQGLREIKKNGEYRKLFETYTIGEHLMAK